MRRWRCRVCGYIHEGPEPPDFCPVCGAPKEDFEEVVDAATSSGTGAPDPVLDKAGHGSGATRESGADPSSTGETGPGPSSSPVAPLAADGSLKGALYSLSYGLFVVTSHRDGKFNGQTCNTVIQITSEPARIAIAINKRNLTHEFISESKALAVTVLGRDNLDLVRRFGFASGRTTDKFTGVDYALGAETGCPVLKHGIAFLEARLVPGLSVDAGTHTLFVADVVGGGVIRDAIPLTYRDYRELKDKPVLQAGSEAQPGPEEEAGPAQSEDRDRQKVIDALNPHLAIVSAPIAAKGTRPKRSHGLARPHVARPAAAACASPTQGPYRIPCAGG